MSCAHHIKARDIPVSGVTPIVRVAGVHSKQCDSKELMLCASCRSLISMCFTHRTRPQTKHGRAKDSIKSRFSLRLEVQCGPVL